MRPFFIVTDVFVAATQDHAEAAGRLLHDFMTEFDAESSGADALGARLHRLIEADDGILVLLAGPPAAPLGLAVAVIRPTSFVDGRALMLEELYVIPSRRGEGIGGAIMERALAEARARDVGFFEIGVDEGDAGARRFYERHGFTNVAVAGTDERMLYYEREL